MLQSIGGFLLLGWWSGAGIILNAGLSDGLEFACYSVALFVVLLTRILKRLNLFN